MKADCWLVKRLKRIDLPSPLGIPSGFAQRAAETLVDLHTSPTAPSPPSGNLLDFAGADKRKSHSNIMLVKMYLVVIVYVSLWLMTRCECVKGPWNTKIFITNLQEITVYCSWQSNNCVIQVSCRGRHSLWIYSNTLRRGWQPYLTAE